MTIPTEGEAWDRAVRCADEVLRSHLRSNLEIGDYRRDAVVDILNHAVGILSLAAQQDGEWVSCTYGADFMAFRPRQPSDAEQGVREA